LSVLKKAVFSAVLLFLAIVALVFVGVALEPLFGWGFAPMVIIVGSVLVVVCSMRVLPKFLFSGFLSPFLGMSKDAQRVLSTGRPAKATVLSIGENSGGGVVTLNDQPYLNLKMRVEDGLSPPYEVSLNTIIPRAAVPQFQPGAVLTVRIDPQNPMNLVLEPSRREEANIPSYGGSDWTEEDRRLLREKGVPCQATLLEVTDTGRSLDFNPVAKVSWEVQVPGTSPYRVSKEVPVSTEAVQQLRGVIGKTFAARVHPTDREKIIVDVRFY
jgi:hypothetical protein